MKLNASETWNRAVNQNHLSSFGSNVQLKDASATSSTITLLGRHLLHVQACVITFQLGDSSFKDSRCPRREVSFMIKKNRLSYWTIPRRESDVLVSDRSDAWLHDLL